MEERVGRNISRRKNTMKIIEAKTKGKEKKSSKIQQYSLKLLQELPGHLFVPSRAGKKARGEGDL